MDIAHRLAEHRAALQRCTSVPIPPVLAYANLGRPAGRPGGGSRLADVCATEIRVNAAAARDLSDAALAWTLAHEVGHLVVRRPIDRVATKVASAAAFLLAGAAVACVFLAAGHVLAGIPGVAGYVFAAPGLLAAALVMVLGFLAARRRDELLVDRWAARLVGSAAGAREAFTYAHAQLSRPPGWYWRPSTLLSSHPPAARRLAAIEAEADV